MGATVLQFASLARQIETAQAAETKRASSARLAAVKVERAAVPVDITSNMVPSVAECQSFIIAARNCRDFETKNKFMSDNIATYWRQFPGIDSKAPAAAWLDSATREASRLIRVATTRRDIATAPYTRSTAPTCKGFVAGMPDPRQVEVAGLQAQCRALVDDISRASFARASTADAERLLKVARQRLADLGAAE